MFPGPANTSRNFSRTCGSPRECSSLLNELESIRRGLASAGINFEGMHPDVQAVSKNKKPLLVRLRPNGALDIVELLSESLWTFREGKHNSFPLVSSPPLL